MRGVGPQYRLQEKHYSTGGLKQGRQRYRWRDGRFASQRLDGGGLRKAQLKESGAQSTQDPGATRGHPTAKQTLQLGNPASPRPKTCSSVPALPAS